MVLKLFFEVDKNYKNLFGLYLNIPNIPKPPHNFPAGPDLWLQNIKWVEDDIRKFAKIHLDAHGIDKANSVTGSNTWNEVECGFHDSSRILCILQEGSSSYVCYIFRSTMRSISSRDTSIDKELGFQSPGTAANINPLRGRADPCLKLHQAQRDVENDLTHENSGGSYNNFDFGPDVSSERVAEQGVEKAWYAFGNKSTETLSRLARNSSNKACSKRDPRLSIDKDIKCHIGFDFKANVINNLSSHWCRTYKEQHTFWWKAL
ncbi:zinc finger, C2H2, ENTH/VHS [Artemisia annua]|uniref:Zinc finger, C2H2, ENTH/VHS n=1 Tax=Artemisia annua TaxID=35608 RepID=A0A2U1Q2Y6_ARTAN|nr:zinc finger, C2H2, ENTH/VHS [Artemisia annua]